MECTIDKCLKEIAYKERQICQMHYFRYMRNGTYELIQSRKYRISNPAGYQKIFEPDHELANSDGYIYEHRFIVFNRYGHNLPDCELCGAPTNWKTCHIDHIDEDVSNNNPNNIRPVCRPCNTMRSRIKNPEHIHLNHTAITCRGETKTAAEWARHEGVKIACATIRFRLRKGMAAEEAIFSPRKTHQSTKTKVKVARDWSS